jgi:hypothetical protein
MHWKIVESSESLKEWKNFLQRKKYKWNLFQTCHRVLFKKYWRIQKLFLYKTEILNQLFGKLLRNSQAFSAFYRKKNCDFYDIYTFRQDDFRSQAYHFGVHTSQLSILASSCSRYYKKTAFKECLWCDQETRWNWQK